MKEENNVVEVWSFLMVYTARLKWLTVNFKLAIKDDSFSPLGVELVSDRVSRKEKIYHDAIYRDLSLIVIKLFLQNRALL